MYCPKCGMQALENAAFCRSCGANLSLVPQALTGQLMQPDGDGRRRRKHKKPKTIGEAIGTIFSGLGFVAVAFATLYFAPAGRLWWFWLLIPAFTLMGSGLATLAELKLGQTASSFPQTPIPPAKNTGEFPNRAPQQIGPPPSVVEGTTRHLDADRERSS